MKNEKKLFVILLLGILMVIYLLLSQLFDIAIPCVFYKITGFYCPGCGITRSLVAIFHLDFYQAFRYNPAVFIVLPLFLIVMACDVLSHKLRNRRAKFTEPAYYVLLCMLVIYGIARNIPAFSFLQPTLVEMVQLNISIL